MLSMSSYTMMIDPMHYINCNEGGKHKTAGTSGIMRGGHVASHGVFSACRLKALQQGSQCPDCTSWASE